jgi:hypothetical protein
MNTPLPRDEDARLTVLFSAASAPVTDDGFSERVLVRVARASRRRRLVLGVTGAIAIAIAAQPLWQLAGLAGVALASAGAEVSQIAGASGSVLGLSKLLVSYLMQPVPLAAATLLALVPGVLRWLED